MSTFVPSKYQSAIAETFKIPAIRIAVNAVAGSGKTKTIEWLCSHLTVNEQCKAIAVCLNVTIRDEMARRLPPNMTVINFHRLGKQIIDSNLRVRSRVDKWKYVNYLQESILDLFGEKDRDLVARAEAALTMGRVNLINFDDNTQFASILDAYEIEPFDGIQKVCSLALRRGVSDAERGIIDFNDMVCLPYEQNMRTEKYGIVLVDECQDLNPAQAFLVTSMLRPDSKCIAVGDPRQAIYGFAGASHNSFYDLLEKIEGKELPLSVCYRCPSLVVNAAKEIVPNIEAAPNAIEGTLKSVGYSEALKLFKPLENDMVVCRTTAPLVGLCFDLIKARIPAKIRGRDIAANLSTLAKNVLKNSAWDEFLTGLDDLFEKESANYQKRPTVAKEAKLQQLKDKSDALVVLYSHAMQDGIAGFDAFSEYILSFFDDKTNGVVTLSTVHKAKGLEAPNVFILGIENFPHPMARSEDAKRQEMNLKYVAITRAQKCLYYMALKPKSGTQELEYVDEG